MYVFFFFENKNPVKRNKQLQKLDNLLRKGYNQKKVTIFLQWRASQSTTLWAE